MRGVCPVGRVQGTCVEAAGRDTGAPRWTRPSNLLSPQMLGFLFFATACFLYKPAPGSSDGMDASLPSQSSASANPTDLQLQSSV